MSDITFEDNKIYTDDKEIELRNEIEEFVTHDGIIIVRLSPTGEEHDPRNVIGINKDGHKLWDIEPVRMNPDGGSFSSYTSLWKDNDSVIVANWNSNDYKVDPESGEVSHFRTVK